MKRLTTILCILMLAVATAAAGAAPNAWLDRDRIELGETATLNIEIIDSMARPDFGALAGDFDLRGTSSRTEATISGGRAVTRSLWAVALEPRRTGVFTIPPIPVGGESTAPLTLTVAEPRAGSAAAGDPVFLETEIETTSPYVQQSVVYTVRLHYTVTLLEGQLDAPEPQGVVLRRLGEDANYVRVIEGIRYNVVERRYVLVPERSGTLDLPPPRFRGRTLGGAGSRFGTGQVLNALGEAFSLAVRPRPGAAAQPWLPAHAFALRYEAPPAEASAGEPFALVLRAEAVGLTAEQMPEIALPTLDGVQVYPEAPSVRERVRDGRPVTEWTRRFAIVAPRQGRLDIPAFGVDWWDVGEDRAARAELPALEIALRPGVAAPSPATPEATAGDAVPPALPPAAPATGFPWPWLSAALAVLWLLTLAWGWRRGRRHPVGAPVAARPRAPSPRGKTLRDALAGDDLDAIADALLDAAPAPRPTGLAMLAGRLADPAQAHAARLLDAARWGGGDAAEARAAARHAFARPPVFREEGTAAPERTVLPPHYPPHRGD